MQGSARSPRPPARLQHAHARCCAGLRAATDARWWHRPAPAGDPARCTDCMALTHYANETGACVPCPPACRGCYNATTCYACGWVQREGRVLRVSGTPPPAAVLRRAGCLPTHPPPTRPPVPQH